MKYILAIFLFVSQSGYAFTLSTATAYKYSTKEVKLSVANDTCSGLGLDPSALLDLVEEAMDDFWNSVPTADIKFVRGGVGTFSANGHISVGSFMTSNGVVNEIIIGCNNDVTDFGSGTIGKGGFQYNSATGMKGGFIIYDDASVAALDKTQKKALIAHELGHAFGLGHSNFKPALMYYIVNPKMTALSRDDEDGITYLYPKTKKVGGCGTIEDISKAGPKNGNKEIMFLLLLVFGVLVSKQISKNSLK
ncbi:MAG: matrixin family metalloprotease [Bacteriovoracaceae bacterium]|nr:matrixin family metalloprotease [Bacteriovoracaceae bacterium]